MSVENKGVEETQSFVIRMWQERLGQWRGKISHVQSKESRAFTRLEESHRFMAERLSGVAPANKAAGRQEAVTIQAPISKFQVLMNGWLPQRRSLRLAMAAVAVCVLAAIAVMFYYPEGDSAVGMVGAAAGSGLGSTLIFFLGAVVGGAAVAMGIKLRRRT